MRTVSTGPGVVIVTTGAGVPTGEGRPDSWVTGDGDVTSAGKGSCPDNATARGTASAAARRPINHAPSLPLPPLPSSLGATAVVGPTAGALAGRGGKSAVAAGCA